MRAGLNINGPFRGDKHTIWEGGFRVPFIVRWPGRVEAGATSDAMINLMDIFATVTEVVGGRMPAAKQAAPDSFSFQKALSKSRESSAKPRQAMILSNATGTLAIRRGPWKYIEGDFPPGVPKGRRKHFAEQSGRQLYHLGRDPKEQNNVIEKHPKVAERLQARLDAIRNAEASRSLTGRNEK